MRRLVFHPEISRELLEAVTWLDDREQDPTPGNHLIDVFSSGARAVYKNPYAKRKVYREFRHIVLRPFKYLLYYRVTRSEVVLVLLVHGARDPDFIRGTLNLR